LDQRHAALDTGVFSAHLVRGLSCSAALPNGVHIVDILTMADWSRIPFSRGSITVPQEIKTMPRSS